MRAVGIRLSLLAVACLSANVACGSTSQNSDASNTSADASDARPANAMAMDGGGSANPTVDGGMLTCKWVLEPNCWKSTLAAAESCLPPFDPNNPSPGHLSADLSQCTFPTGQTVAFSGELGVAPSFSVTSDGGAPCLSMDQLPAGFTITTAAGTVGVSVDDPTLPVFGQVLTVTCPDGTSLSASYLQLVDCGNSVTPGKVTSTGTSSNPDGGQPVYRISISFNDPGANAYDAVVAFSCLQ
jgi:hypothetical protein